LIANACAGYRRDGLLASSRTSNAEQSPSARPHARPARRRRAKPARIYDLRSTFASNALAAGVTVFELARVMGTSVRMIERHYGALLDGAHTGIAGRLDAFETELVRVGGE
jgi:hypothetical protein